MRYSVFQASKRGSRSTNEDRMGYCYTRNASLFILADGMGGHPEGEVAAQLAIQTISALFQRDARPTLDNVAGFLPNALLAAHHQILRYAGEKGMLDTPRTTLVAVVVQAGHAHWIHCGDSRFYLIREGQLLVRTKDHSYVERQSPAEMNAKVNNRNVLFTCLGSPTKPIFDLDSAPLEKGDRLLLCSDGLWSSLNDAGIVEQLSHQSVGKAVPLMVDMAIERAQGYSDNVTVIALEWEASAEEGDDDAGVSTEEISDDVFASTIQPALLDNLAEDEFDDEAIERSIAEINEAIRRSSSSRNHPGGA